MFLLPIAFLFPLATYLLILGLINRRRSPLMVPGTWDFVGILFGTSGFILGGGWFLLHNLAEQMQSLSIFDFRSAGAEGPNPWALWLLVGLFFVLIVLGVLYVLLQRRMHTTVYNVDPRVFERVLVRVLDESGLRWSRTGNQLIIQAAQGKLVSTAISNEGLLPLPGAPEPGQNDDVAALTIQPFGIGYSVGLSWECHTARAEHAIRQELEHALDRELSEIVTEDNQVALWLVSPSFLMLIVIFLCLVLQLLALMLRS